MTETKKNPFIAGNWVRGDSFFGRTQIIREALEGNRDFVWVAGTRRFGKTSLLKQLEWLTSPPNEYGGYVPLFWDMQGSQDLDGLRESLLESIEDAVERFENIDVDIDALEAMDLFEVLRELRRKAKAHQRRLLLLCDEVEELITVEKHNPEALPKLRRILQRGENVRTIITATKRLEQLESATLPETSPFLHGFVPPFYLTPLDADQSKALLALGSFNEKTTDEIIEKTNNHPYLTQLIGRRLFENELLHEVIEEIALDDMIGNFFSIDFKYLDDSEKEILLHILSNDMQSLEALKTKFSDSAATLVKQLYELNQLGFIHQEKKQYRISNYFFKQWLMREKDRLFSDSTIKRAEIGEALVQALPGNKGTLQVGDMLEQHEILEKIGSGGMGAVYKARDTQLDRLVALKVLLPELVRDQQFKDRFLAEARAASAINHPNVATIYYIGVQNDIHYISMELLEGQSLKTWRRFHESDLEAQLSVAKQVGQALHHAHQKGIIHRDIKSDNILVTHEGTVKVMDFGLAKTLRKADLELTKTGTTLGTLAYMSPEQASGLELDARTDIFSYGVVLYELFTGVLPFTGDYELSVMYAILNEEPKPPCDLNATIPQHVQRVIQRALEKDRERRFQSVQELLEELQ